MAIGDKHHPTPRQQSWARFPIYRANVYSTKHPQLQKPAFLVILVQVTREDGKYYGIIMHADIQISKPEDEKRSFHQLIYNQWRRLCGNLASKAVPYPGKVLLQTGVPNASSRTIQRAMGTLGYRKCITCEKGWVSPSDAKRRVEAAKIALQYRPYPED